MPFFGNAKGLCSLEEACIRSEQGGALALFLVSYVDLLISVQFWKGVHDNSKDRLPTVSAIFAAGTEENLRSFLIDLESNKNLEKVIEFWLVSLQQVRKRDRRARKSLVPMDPPRENTLPVVAAEAPAFPSERAA